MINLIRNLIRRCICRKSKFILNAKNDDQISCVIKKESSPINEVISNILVVMPLELVSLIISYLRHAPRTYCVRSLVGHEYKFKVESDETIKNLKERVYKHYKENIDYTRPFLLLIKSIVWNSNGTIKLLNDEYKLIEDYDIPDNSAIFIICPLSNSISDIFTITNN